MFENLKTIKNIQTKIDYERIIIKNNNQQTTYIIKDKVKFTEIILSAINDKGFKITFKNGDFLIITSSDFIFKTRNLGLFQIQNLPALVSLNKIIDNALEYIKNPEPNNNIDNTISLYLLNKTLLENAEYYNFNVEDLKNKVRKTALKTNSIGDITIYD